MGTDCEDFISWEALKTASYYLSRYVFHLSICSLWRPTWRGMHTPIKAEQTSVTFQSVILVHFFSSPLSSAVEFHPNSLLASSLHRPPDLGAPVVAVTFRPSTGASPHCRRFIYVISPLLRKVKPSNIEGHRCRRRSAEAKWWTRANEATAMAESSWY